MLIKEVHSVFKERFNRLASNYHEDFSPYQIDTMINDAMNVLLEKASANESSSRFVNLFASVTVTDASVATTRVNGNTYTVNLDDLDYPFYKDKRIVAKTTCGDIRVVIEGHGRIDDLLIDAFQRPSKKWRRIVGIVEGIPGTTNRKLIIYTEDGFAVDMIDIAYVRYPKPVFFGGYDNPSFLECQLVGGEDCSIYDNLSTPARTIDLHEQYHSLMIDFAVQETLRSLGLANEFQLRQMKTAEFVNNQ